MQQCPLATSRPLQRLDTPGETCREEETEEEEEENVL